MTRFASAVVALLTVAADAAAPAAPVATATAAADMKFVPFNPADPKGNQISIIYGDMKAPTQLLLKIPAGSKAPQHFHTSDYYGVVLAGAPAHGDVEATAKTRTVGSVWFEPGKHSHFDACPGKEDCLVLITFTGPLDFIPVGADGKPLPPPAAPKK